MSDTEEQLTSPPPYCLDNRGEFLAVSKYTTPKNEEYYAAKNEYSQKKHEYGLYEDILREIRNMTVLTPYQLHYLKGVSNEQLLQIIEIYNLVMRNVNEIL